MILKMTVKIVIRQKKTSDCLKRSLHLLQDSAVVIDLISSHTKDFITASYILQVKLFYSLS